MFIVRNRKIWYILSGILVIISLFSVFYFGLKLSIDFTGGSLLEVEYQTSRPQIYDLQNATNKLNLGNISFQPTGEKGLLLRLRTLTEDEHQNLLNALGINNQYKLNEIRFDSIGPVIGSELQRKSLIAISLVVLMIILYIAFAFRKVSKPVSSFKYGLMAVVALVHDVTVPTGVFAILGKFFNVEIDILFITALLTILGFSVHDTIVVFDRVRENLKKGIGKGPTSLKLSQSGFEETVGLSVNQTIVRSINTSLTVLLVLLAIFFFGGETTKYFALALLIGVFLGTYSSIFLASPLLVTLYNFQQRKKTK
ncbi:MAG: protein translocase subunit SecF [Patescibacteria group bacterium]